MAIKNEHSWTATIGLGDEYSTKPGNTVLIIGPAGRRKALLEVWNGLSWRKPSIEWSEWRFASLQDQRLDTFALRIDALNSSRPLSIIIDNRALDTVRPCKDCPGVLMVVQTHSNLVHIPYILWFNIELFYQPFKRIEPYTYHIRVASLNASNIELLFTLCLEGRP